MVLVWFILFIYGICALFVLGFSMVQFGLWFQSTKSVDGQKNVQKDPQILPFVTIQLPVYNEKYVIERLLIAASEQDYPKERFEIQVLDDSNDETSAIIDQSIVDLRLKGIDIKACRRESREGYKAGALSYFLPEAKGDFIAIFDADFVPASDFLSKTVSLFTSKNIGMVQTRWTHINRDYNLFTRLQAFGLNAHFTIEQIGRQSASYFINFNGTGGMWRKTCILDSGGWQSDTLTEDLDLSYRAQLKGWKLIYTDKLESPAELPVAMSAIKSQQFRWTKGAAECAIKLLPGILLNGDIPGAKRINAFYHLSNAFVFIAILITGVLSVPLLFVKHQFGLEIIFAIASLFSISFPVFGFFYWKSNRSLPEHDQFSNKEFMLLFPTFIAVFSGLSLHNSIAVIEGMFGVKTSFVRTPKFNLGSMSESWMNNEYLTRRVSWLTYVEFLLGLYFLFAIFFGIYLDDYGMLPFHLMLMIGFCTISLSTIIPLVKFNFLNKARQKEIQRSFS